MKTLILGGVRSGKSRLAERLAGAAGAPVCYIATARDHGDAELRARIAAHRARRPPHWTLVEAPLALAAALRREAAAGRVVIVDCLTLWLTNLLCEADAAGVEREREALLDAVPALPGTLILVANETGLGVVPLGALTRRYVDEAGVLHQRLAERCERVLLTVAGLPLALKGSL
ncbi:bifunctional adenosylcobinamide kinase/adenosylcobinamide-phosphate guanylyltransferase [Solimonas variicoloris]|uniref:bifunctional adenosylcobinamide kinase/adenosylcobinamide-phosphate guanylyltransferase n=1 Tax=Solimonas variicoloris TaxID=254408 RepID=UPI00036DBC4F|nr:bifunctional adenosylcobinamide kinase/adenosylcobinamide-phosphate guanylyltransferase [Solimonas variicoloris]